MPKRNDAPILLRREKVAQCMAAAMTVRETTELLANNGLVNPKTGKPWSRETIHRDMQHLREEWKENAAAAIEEHRAEVLHTLRYIRRKALTGKTDLQTALKAVKQESDLLGLDEAKKILLEGELNIADQRRKADERLEELGGDGLPPVPEKSDIDD